MLRLVVTPEGYFSGSAKYLRHRKPGTNELYPKEVSERFRRPDLMAKLLAR